MIVTFFITILSETTCRHVELSRRVHRTMIGCNWVVHHLGVILGSVGHRVKIHKITPVTDKERGDLEMKDYVVLQKPHTTGRLYHDFSRLLFLHTHREPSALVNEAPEETDQFRFLRVTCYVNIKGSSFTPPPRFTRRRHPLSLFRCSV